MRIYNFKAECVNVKQTISPRFISCQKYMFGRKRRTGKTFFIKAHVQISDTQARFVFASPLKKLS